MNTPTQCAITPLVELIDNFDSGSKRDRNSEIVKTYLGLDGNGGASMESAGSKHSLTRESVRQILGKYKKVLEAHKSSFEGLKKIIAILEKNSPISAEAAEQILSEAGLIPHGFNIEGVIETAKYMDIKKNGTEIQIVKEKSCWSNSVSRFVVTPKYAELPKSIFSKILKETSHNGASSVIHISNEISVNKNTGIKFVRDLVDSIPESKWLDEEKNWFYFSDNGRNRLTSRLTKIFSIYSEASFTNVKEAIRRSINKQNLDIFRRLPDSVLKSIFISEGLTISDDTVSTSKPLISDNKILDFEKLIVEAINKEENRRISELKLENAVVNNLTEKYAFSMVLNYSPLLVRKKRGIYELTGKQ